MRVCAIVLTIGLLAGCATNQAAVDGLDLVTLQLQSYEQDMSNAIDVLTEMAKEEVDRYYMDAVERAEDQIAFDVETPLQAVDEYRNLLLAVAQEREKAHAYYDGLAETLKTAIRAKNADALLIVSKVREFENKKVDMETLKEAVTSVRSTVTPLVNQIRQREADIDLERQAARDERLNTFIQGIENNTLSIILGAVFQ